VKYRQTHYAGPAFSPDWQILAVQVGDKKVQLLRVPDATPLLTMATDLPVERISFFPDGQTLLLEESDREKDRSVLEWRRASDGAVLQSKNLDKRLTNCASLSPDGATLALVDNHSVELRRISDWSLLQTLPRSGVGVFWECAAFFSPDGQKLAVIDDKTVNVWDVASGRRLHAFTGHTESVDGVAFSYDSRLLASASAPQTVQVWQVK
jgi:WD40 repeat protein